MNSVATNMLLRYIDSYDLKARIAPKDISPAPQAWFNLFFIFIIRA